ncbi:hypothetical protein HG536_0B02160 [Torulaspora globosa]|uniref:histone deacetylase n=1 Tax=Torulaspora globosa TaxID=48254 RepID=A0A7G3ZCW7_9SACH|nr:uncharacterized protein HG536_0B02160 [Torulaspora globosa]QLL31353.1 hypothetical protein HG536_0B02160 [Torulaspora globosa]
MVKTVISTSEFQAQVSDLLPCNKCRKSQLTHALIQSFSLLDGFDKIIRYPICSKKDILQFHTAAYADAILNERLNRVLPSAEDESEWSQLPDLASCWNGRETNRSAWFESRLKLYSKFKAAEKTAIVVSRKRSAWDALLEDDSHGEDYGEDKKIDPEDLKKYNLEGDCPMFSYLPMYCQVVTGATLALADEAVRGEKSISINWDGGRHHAFKQKASGFCYVNDIVLLIQKLRSQGFESISYVDFDLHHGDGVEKAFQYSKHVQTISLHMFEAGFFPGTGSLQNNSRGSNVVNIPLLHGLDDMLLDQLVGKLVKPLLKKHRPEALIIQCGGDGLMGDGFNEWQLSIRQLAKCIVNLASLFENVPVFLLGGGGYNETLMSRFYAYLTYKILRKFSLKQIPNFDFDTDALIPDHEFVEAYAHEGYKFWAYEQEGGLRKKHLKNDNNPELLTLLQNHYNVKLDSDDNISENS